MLSHDFMEQHVDPLYLIKGFVSKETGVLHSERRRGGGLQDDLVLASELTSCSSMEF